jgi:hypothetical protein
MREKALPTIKCQRVIDSTKGGWREREKYEEECAPLVSNGIIRQKCGTRNGRVVKDGGDMEFLHFSS